MMLTHPSLNDEKQQFFQHTIWLSSSMFSFFAWNPKINNQATVCRVFQNVRQTIASIFYHLPMLNITTYVVAYECFSQKQIFKINQALSLGSLRLCGNTLLEGVCIRLA